MRTGPCEWPIVYPEGGCPELSAIAEPGAGKLAAADVEELATAYLWAWTNKVYGLCDVTIRPARADCQEPTYRSSYAPWTPVLVDGTWHNLRCGTCGDTCACPEPRSIRLPGPVASVTAVTIDGEALDPAAYRVDNRARLVRQDGGAWPLCNDLTKPVNEEGTWSVSYVRGVAVPKGGRIAAGVFACELAKALTGSAECALPQRIQTVTREGVTVGLLDPFDGLDDGRTGIWVIDSWLASVTKTRSRSSVHSPDARGPTRTTYQGPSS